MEPVHDQSLGERIALIWRRGVRLAMRLAIAFALSTAAAIGLAVAVTDNAFFQILIMIVAPLAFWAPFVFLVAGVERLFTRRHRPRPEHAALNRAEGGQVQESWRRLAAAAPRHKERLAVLTRSLERSRLSLGKAGLDADAHDLCVLIDRRLPELIDRDLDNLPPDDRNRARQLDELVDLIEQFARHCSRKLSGDQDMAGNEAAILRRRFEDHLSLR